MSWAEAKKTQLDAVEKLAHTPEGMRAFSALPNNAQSINLTFLEPDHIWLNNGTVLWTETEGVMIRYSDTAYPASPTDGTLAIDNKELGKYQTTPYAVNGLTEGTTYYFSAFPYSTEGIYGPVSHATAVPFEGERVQVQMTLPEGLESATVKCVDETASTSEEQEVTQSQNTATFFVDTGHTYHIEYSDEYGYVTPSQTSSKVAVGGVTEMYSASYSVFSATINVTYTEGSTCTCSNGDVTLTAADTTGFYAFTVGRTGMWTIQITKEGEDEPKSTTVEITSNGQTEAVEITFIPIVPWSTGSDEDIAAMLEAHYAGKINIYDYWEVGQERTVNMSDMGNPVEGDPNSRPFVAQTISLVLLHPGGIKLAGTQTECAFCVGVKNVLTGKATFADYPAEVTWKGSVAQSWCNNNFRNGFPETLRPIFKQFKQTVDGKVSTDYFSFHFRKHVVNSPNTSGQPYMDYYKIAANRVKNNTYYTCEPASGSTVYAISGGTVENNISGYGSFQYAPWGII